MHNTGSSLKWRGCVAKIGALYRRVSTPRRVFPCCDWFKTLAAITIPMALAGCGMGPEYTTCPPSLSAPAVTNPPTRPATPGYANPVQIPITDSQAAWEQVVDVVDDYFRIEREEPVRTVGNMLTEGTITTSPAVSPTIFEPWRQDTGDHDQRVENTLQSIRRRAVVRVIPTQGGHWVEVQVFKELEDVERPEFATAGAATFRYDSTLSGIENPIGEQRAAKGWISIGRDTALEQNIIADLLSRCGQTATPVTIQTRNGNSQSVPAASLPGPVIEQLAPVPNPQPIPSNPAPLAPGSSPLSSTPVPSASANTTPR